MLAGNPWGYGENPQTLAETLPAAQAMAGWGEAQQKPRGSTNPSTTRCRALGVDAPTHNQFKSHNECRYSATPPIPAHNYGFKVQNSPARLTRQERGEGTKPAPWFGTPETPWPFLRTSRYFLIFFFSFCFAPFSGCDSSLGGISSQRAAPDELLLIYSMCRQAYWGIRAPCSCSKTRVSLHMELIKKKLRV